MSEKLTFWAQKATERKQKPRGETINVQLRLHTELHAMLVREASENFRSFNGEVAYRLLKSFNIQPDKDNVK